MELKAGVCGLCCSHVCLNKARTRSENNIILSTINILTRLLHSATNGR